ncbi:MAG: hypothetical protein PF542_05695 [Nanoarchaeota archaeon]|jgi:hypothetical protein|nr:hypothetical protein [Nanoarchaeota archaeon]
MKLGKVLQYETYIILGLLMVAGTIGKLIFNLPIDSDWFWFIAGTGLVLEGFIDLIKQRQFSKKYKVVSKKEFESMWNDLKAADKKK